ncbi:hypothetical protein BCU66_010270 [Vibrio sp. 10N.286.49.B1]|uniref:agarase n=1 Tax=unclassified Vibrio TaxID=2614977 RepID=UPI000C85B937|nr:MULTISPECIES: agarase [unclassified Vibrio]
MIKKNSLLLLIATAFGLAGCGGGDGGDTPVTPPPEIDPPNPPIFTGTQVDINFDMKHVVGGIETFDRRKFIGIHASLLENEWHDANNGASNDSDDLITDFLDSYDVYLGRNTGAISWELRNVEEDSVKSGFVDETSMTNRGGVTKNQFLTGANIKFEKGRQHWHRSTDVIIAAQQHPYWPDGTKINSLGDITPWSFSQTDTVQEPLGTATGHYMGQYLKSFFDASSTSADAGEPKPSFVEVMNEPLYDLVDDTNLSDAEKLAKTHKIFEFHNAVAVEVLKANPDALIGGYTAAFPNFEEDNFQRWEDRDKSFIDIAGQKMDFLSLHLYDFPAFQNSQRYRRGGNLEATLDMLEQYTYQKFGAPKPMIISEYGAQVHTTKNNPWERSSDWENVVSFNAMLMSFMERPDQILKALPFIVVKGEWGRLGDNIPYESRLMRQADEPASPTGKWVYSDMIYFYELWKDVQGTRVDTWSSAADIQVDAYVTDSKAYIILNSLDFNNHELALNTLGLDGNVIDSVKIKHFLQRSFGGVERGLIEETYSLPDTINLSANSTMVLELTFASDVAIIETNEETKYYADTYKQSINANQPITFDIDNVQLGNNGEAVLRMGIGRDFGKTLQPTLTLNGKVIEVPEDFRGDDQYLDGKGRNSFFGLIEVPVELADINVNNKIEVKFNDNGGYVSSMTLQVFDSSRELVRTRTQ